MRWGASEESDLARVAVHGVGSIIVGLLLVLEDRAGYAYPVFVGPRAMFSWTRFDPFGVWGVLFLVCGALVLSSSRRLTLCGLLVLVGAWGAFGGGSLLEGLTSPAAGSVGGAAFLLIAVGAMQRLIELAAKKAPVDRSDR